MRVREIVENSNDFSCLLCSPSEKWTRLSNEFYTFYIIIM